MNVRPFSHSISIMMQLQSKRVMAAPNFDVHRAESPNNHTMEAPQLDAQRAQSCHLHVRALNTQYARYYFLVLVVVISLIYIFYMSFLVHTHVYTSSPSMPMYYQVAVGFLYASLRLCFFFSVHFLWFMHTFFFYCFCVIFVTDTWVELPLILYNKNDFIITSVMLEKY